MYNLKLHKTNPSILKFTVENYIVWYYTKIIEN